MTTHKVLRGLTYEGRRAEVGDVVTDIPSKSVPWLKEQGLIEEVAGQQSVKPSKREPVSESEGDK